MMWARQMGLLSVESHLSDLHDMWVEIFAFLTLVKFYTEIGAGQ